MTGAQWSLVFAKPPPMACFDHSKAATLGRPTVVKRSVAPRIHDEYLSFLIMMSMRSLNILVLFALTSTVSAQQDSIMPDPFGEAASI